MKKIAEIIGNILFWTITVWIIVELFAIESQDIEIRNGVETVTTHKNILLQNLLLLGSCFKITMFYMNYYLITSILSKKLNFKKYTFIALGLFIVFFLIETLASIIYSDISLLILSYKLNAGLYLFYFSISSMYGFIKVWLRNEKRRQLLEKEKKDIELNLLRAQLNPHFLFNTLNNILSMSQKNNNPELSNSISKLSDLMRYLIYEANKNKVPIIKEIEFLRDLIELHLLRYNEDEIDISFKVIGNTNDVMIEPGILVSFIENAFKHGVTIERKSFINLEIDVTEKNNILFEISNSLLERENENDSNGFGIKNIKERLDLVYSNNYELNVTEKENEFKVKLKIIVK